MKFKAAILIECKKPLAIEEITLNSLKKGQVLLKILKSGICRSQIFEINGDRGEDKWLPHLLGHEAIGEVIDIGESVKKVGIGDKVIASWISSEGISAEPAKYSLGGVVINGGQITTFSEFSVCSENKLIKISNDSIRLIGPTLGCAIPTGYGITLNEKRLKKARFVGVLGLGGIGISAIVGSKNNSTSKVIGIDINNDRLKDAKNLGADFLINPKDTDLEKGINSITNGEMLDLLIECSGSIVGLNSSLKLINNNGLVKFATHPKHGDLLSIDPFELIKGKKIEGSWGGGISPDKDLKRIVTEIQENHIFIEMMNQDEYKLEEINTALGDMSKGKVLRPIIQMY